VPVTAHGYGNAGPVSADAPDHVTQNHRRLRARRPLAGAQQKTHRPARGGVINVDRLKAIPMRVGIEQRQLLVTMCPVGRIVDVEHNVARVFPEAGAEQIDQPEPHSCQITPGRGILQPRQGRLGGQRGATVRKTFAGNPERRVMAQGIKIVAILIPAGNRKHAFTDHRGVVVDRTSRVARILQAGRQHAGKVHPPFNLAQQQHTSVR